MHLSTRQVSRELAILRMTVVRIIYELTAADQALMAQLCACTMCVERFSYSGMCSVRSITRSQAVARIADRTASQQTLVISDCDSIIAPMVSRNTASPILFFFYRQKTYMIR